MGRSILVGIITLFLGGLAISFAHPGRTASDGCHYCRTNCDYRGESYGERHCHGGGSSNSNSYSSYSAFTYTPQKTQDELCHEKYPGTIYRANDQWCACPSDQTGTSSWSQLTQSCTPPKQVTEQSYDSQDQLCHEKYPGTIYRSTDQWCACPGDQAGSSSRNAQTLSCYAPPTNTQNTKEEFKNNQTNSSQTTNLPVSCPENSTYDENDQICYCDTGYIISDNKTACVEKRIDDPDEWYLSFTEEDVEKQIKKCQDNSAVTYQICVEGVKNNYETLYSQEICENKKKGYYSQKQCKCSAGKRFNKSSGTCELKQYVIKT